MFDTIIHGGEVLDGTGAVGIRTDIGISGDRIVALGELRAKPAHMHVDASGKVVAPGFIEIHGHADYLILVDPHARSKVRQGVTTEVAGNCGFSAVPLGKAWVAQWWAHEFKHYPDGRRRRTLTWDEAKEVTHPYGLDLGWKSTAEYLQEIEKKGTAINYCQLVGHHDLRAAVTGEISQRPSADEVKEMRHQLEQAIDEGAWGFSCGFDIEQDVPQEEFEALSMTTAKHGGVFAFHIRSYGEKLIASVREAIEVCRRTGVRVAVSHLQSGHMENWGKVSLAVQMLEHARAQGLPIVWDVIPFTMGGGNYFSFRMVDLLPASLSEVDDQSHARFLSMDRDEVERILTAGVPTRRTTQADQHMFKSALWDRMTFITKCPSHSEVEDLSVADAAETLGRNSVRAVLDLLADDWEQLHYISCPISEPDLRYLLRHPLTMIGSDGGVLTHVDSMLGRSFPYERLPHPRIYTAFPHVIKRYVRELGDLSLEEAVRRMTSLPAMWFGLHDRGLIRPGMVADVIVFDPKTFEDRPNLHQAPEEISRGLTDVFVSGSQVLQDGRETGRLPGKVLRP